MIEHKGKYYYSCSELSKMFNLDNPITKKVKEMFCQIYGKNGKNFFYDSYLQAKFHSAAKKNMLKYVKYQKENGHKIYIVFNIEDLEEFLSNPNAINIQQKNYKIVEEYI